MHKIRESSRELLHVKLKSENKVKMKKIGNITQTQTVIREHLGGILTQSSVMLINVDLVMVIAK